VGPTTHARVEAAKIVTPGRAAAALSDLAPLDVMRAPLDIAEADARARARLTLSVRFLVHLDCAEIAPSSSSWTLGTRARIFSPCP
jgi:hypothetical protein